MSRPDEHQLWQDERAATLRDRQREHHRHPRYIVAPRTIRLSCPRCNGPIYAMTDSIGETITCTHPDCHAELVTRSTDGAVGLEPRGAQ